ncbi:unnamed protein product [Choristocarpus tenellus]|uniref:30S ribosomal protein S4 n=1 Tax=Choristocarpus tenellus TaxID=116065 RepID=UPI002E774E80|nr:30S ribosomal protein S4 [Choristocarpus tenellus]WAM62294.1 30S ribosomal protein S4 [Choristocarpus tenellus]
MSRYKGPRFRIIRRLGDLPGLTTKILPKNREKTPGQHGKTIAEQKKIKASAYKIRLYEKQKLRYNYGLTERQLLNYIKKARSQKGLTGFFLMQLLEMRLDNILFRLGLAPTIPAARQFINHNHIFVNKKKINICSFQCQPGDIIIVKNKPKTKKLAQDNLNKINYKITNTHIEFNPQLLEAKIKNLITLEDIFFKVNYMLVIEYYSRLL